MLCHRENVGQWCLHIRTDPWGPYKISCWHRCCCQHFVQENIPEDSAEEASNLSRDWHCCQRGFRQSTRCYRSSKYTFCFSRWAIRLRFPDCRDPFRCNIGTRHTNEKSRSSRLRTHDPPNEGHWLVQLDSRRRAHLLSGHRQRIEQNTLWSWKDNPDFHLQCWRSDWSWICTAITRGHGVRTGHDDMRHCPNSGG